MKTTHLLSLGLVLVGSTALGAEAAGQTAASAPAVVQVAPNPGAHLHDGFYLRLATGFGAYNESIRQSGADLESTVSGIASAGEFALGGAVRPGLIFGGGIWSSGVLASDRSLRGTPPPADVIDGRGEFTLVGPFFDHYFDPAGGLHVQGAIGLATIRGLGIDSGRFDRNTLSVGGGVMFGFGYDWWASQEWSLGILGRLAVGYTGQEDDASGTRWYHAVGGTPSVLFTATYN